MIYLFLDTTVGVSIALWSKEQSIVFRKSTYEKKGSQVLHSFIYEALEFASLKVQDIVGIIQIAGPGSYTGMRLSAGVADIFKWQNIKEYSIYHFEIPKLLGISNGLWISSAFKGEYFVYEWNHDENSSCLVAKNQMENYLNNENLFSHHKQEWPFPQSTHFTAQMALDEADKLLPLVIEQNLKRQTYYFRKIEEEFTRPKL